MLLPGSGVMKGTGVAGVAVATAVGRGVGVALGVGVGVGDGGISPTINRNGQAPGVMTASVMLTVDVTVEVAGAVDANPARFQSASARTFLYVYRADQSLGPSATRGVHSWSVTGWDFFGDVVDFRQNVTGHAAARLSLALSNASVHVGETVQASLTLTDAFGNALTGFPLFLETPGQVYALNTDGRGRTSVWFTPRMVGANRLVARFDGVGGIRPAFADAVLYVTSDSADSGDVVRRYDGLLLLFVLVSGLCLVRFR